MPFSSNQIIGAIERHGYSQSEGTGKRGSHRTWTRKGKPGETHNTVVVKLNAREIPEGTLSSILRQLGIDKATLASWIDERLGHS